MHEINIIEALDLAREISKLDGGTFTLAFYPYSRSKAMASAKLRVIHGCKARAQLPDDVFSIDGDNYFLFTDKDGNPKSCYRILIRYIGFSHQKNAMRKVKWI